MENAGSTLFLLYIQTTVHIMITIVKLLKGIWKKKDWNWNMNQQGYIKYCCILFYGLIKTIPYFVLAFL